MKNLGVRLLSVIFVFVVMEIVVKVILPQKVYQIVKQESFGCYRKSGYLPYEYIPDCVDSISDGRVTFQGRINNIGLRGKNVDRKDKTRLLLTGDSFVFGYGVSEEDRIGGQLERLLPDTEVISAGFLGDAGPDTSYSYLTHQGLSLEPDVMLVALFPYNDLSDIQKTQWRVDGTGEILKVAMPDKLVDNDGFLRRKDTPYRYKLWLIRDSHLAQLLIDRVEMSTKIIRAKISLRLGLVAEAQKQHQKFEQCLYQGVCVSGWETARNKTAEIFRRIKHKTDENNITVYAVIIPLKEQVAGEASTKTVFHQLLETAEIDYLDLGEEFRASGAEVSKLYLPDGHFSAVGHRLAAEIIRKWLVE